MIGEINDHMKSNVFFLLVWIFFSLSARAQKNPPIVSIASCNNFDFESGYSGWSGQAWNFVTSTTFVVTPTPPYHKLTGAGFDNIIAPLSTLAPAGGTQSALIGLPNPGSQEYWINQTFLVSAADPVYVYQDAVVFKDLDQFSPPHSPAQQNYFEVMFTDQNGDTIPCGYSKVLVSQATAANGFQPYIYTDPNQSPPNNLIPHLYKDWTSTAVDLTAYIGTNVTVKFKAHSCALGDHYTYAYIDGHCEPAISNNTSVTICQGTTTTLNGPPGFNTYSWLPGGQTTQNIQTGNAGSYTVTATGQSACIQVQTFSVTVNPQPAVFANPTNVNICVGNSTTLTASATPSTGVLFSWAPSTGLNSTTGTPVVAAPTTSATYTVIGTDANGCTNFSTVAVNVGQLPVAVVADQTICGGQTATITASGGSSYLWNTGQTMASISVNPTSTSSYTVVVTNPAGCADTAIVNIVVAPLLVVSVSNATICAGQTATLSASGGVNYSWNTGATTSSVQVNPAFSNSYTVTVSNASGCSGIAIATVSVSPAPVVSVAGATICSGQSATLTASGGTNYSWNTGQTTAFIIVSTTSSYSVTATNANGCTATATVSVLVVPPPVPSVSNATICAGQTGTLTAMGGATYSWNTGATTNSISVSSAGNYSVIVSIGSCSASATGSLSVNPRPTANAGTDITITAGQTTTLTASGGGNYMWDTGNSNAAINVSPGSTTLYCVVITNLSGCSDTSCVTVFVEPVPPVDCSAADKEKLFLPTAFSPNADGENEVIKIFFGYMECIKTFRLEIYNRWGEMVFEAEDPVAVWDGSYKGKIENTAVFAYHLKAELLNGEELDKKGNISLLK